MEAAVEFDDVYGVVRFVGQCDGALCIFLQETIGLVQLQVTCGFCQAACNGFVELLLAHLYHFLDIAYLQVKQTEEGNAHYYA